MKKLSHALLACSLAIAIGLAATSRSARADDSEYKQKYKDMKKKYQKLKDKFDQVEADHIIAINKLRDNALAQIAAVKDSCTAQITALATPSPSPSASATASAGDQGTVASESASGVGITPATNPSTTASVVKPAL